MYDISIMILSASWCSKMLFPVLCTIGDVRTCYLSRTAQVNQKQLIPLYTLQILTYVTIEYPTNMADWQKIWRTCSIYEIMSALNE